MGKLTNAMQFAIDEARQAGRDGVFHMGTSALDELRAEMASILVHSPAELPDGVLGYFEGVAITPPMGGMEVPGWGFSEDFGSGCRKFTTGAVFERQVENGDLEKRS